MVRFLVDGLQVVFPYEYVYPEQYQYMFHLKRTLDAKGHAVLEMPTGTGKTVALLSLITAYQHMHPETGKLIYCTRTVPEMEKALEELRLVAKCRENHLNSCNAEASKHVKILAVGMSARRNMCVHPVVSQSAEREKTDEACRQLTATWVRDEVANSGSRGGNRQLCEFYENFDKLSVSDIVPRGVYTIEDLKAIGRDSAKPFCPYFAARRLIQIANVVVLNYQYVLDPKVAQVFTGSMAPVLLQSSRGNTATVNSSKTNISATAQKESSIIVFDEAHNIDNVCIEALSVTLNRRTLESAGRNLNKLGDTIEETKKVDQRRLQDEYQRLVTGLKEAGQIDSDVFENLQHPVLPNDVLNETVPGNIRRAEHFLGTMRKIVLYLKNYIRIFDVQSEGPLSFLHRFEQETSIESKTLKFCFDRLRSLLNALRVTNVQEFSPLNLVADFCTLVGTYWDGFIVITDPYPEAAGIYDPLLQLSCLDCSLAMKPILQRYQSVILTSGTISPLELYPKILNFQPILTESFPMSLDRNCFCPLIVVRGADQVQLSSKFELRNDVSVVRNYGALLIELTKSVPDGLVAFFTSYSYMENVVSQWYEMGIMTEVMANKLIFLETKDVVSTTLALHNFRRACDCGRGGVFFSVARGKVAEGIDFDRHYGRCVVMFGVPFQYTLSRILKARLEFMRDHFQIKESEFLTFDAMRQAAQCVGRIIRSKSDYGIMVFADQRYAKMDKRSKLPTWILQHLETTNLHLSTDLAISVTKTFLRQMSQPYKATNASRLDETGLAKLEAKCHDSIKITVSKREAEKIINRLHQAQATGSNTHNDNKGEDEKINISDNVAPGKRIKLEDATQS